MKVAPCHAGRHVLSEGSTIWEIPAYVDSVRPLDSEVPSRVAGSVTKDGAAMLISDLIAASTQHHLQRTAQWTLRLPVD